MGKSYRKMWRVVPCTSRAMLRTESKKDIVEILKTKLATIIEEPETVSEDKWHLQVVVKSVKKMTSKKKSNGCFVPKFSFKESYALFMAAGFASKGSKFGGLVQY